MKAQDQLEEEEEEQEEQHQQEEDLSPLQDDPGQEEDVRLTNSQTNQDQVPIEQMGDEESPEREN